MTPSRTVVGRKLLHLAKETKTWALSNNSTEAEELACALWVAGTNGLSGKPREWLIETIDKYTHTRG